MRLERVTIAAIVVGALAIGSIVVFGPRAAQEAAAHPTPILQPITPSGFPYSTVSLLRRQRMSTDVLPTTYTATDSEMVSASARHVVTVGNNDVWLAVDYKDELCLIFTSRGDGGGSTACEDGATTATHGGLLGAGIGEHLEVDIVSDGTQAAVERRKGYRQVAPNAWLSGSKPTGAAPAISSFADPDAFPLSGPYADFALLRRPQEASDAPPAFLRNQSGGEGQAPIVLDTVRYAGEWHRAKAWIGLSTAGEVCLVVTGDQSDSGTSCGMPQQRVKKGSQVAGFGSGNIFVSLFADGKPSTDDTRQLHKVAPNVWIGKIND
ncbi:MAG: hypothetical protein JWP75_3720 [Frondihabitans sp.]|nr:hypothetical protein [Frondihabitans sp.]